jgi:hypothetical protein
MQPIYVLFSPGSPAAPLSVPAGSVALRPTLSNGLPLSSSILMSKDLRRFLRRFFNKDPNWFEGYSLLMPATIRVDTMQKKCQERGK